MGSLADVTSGPESTAGSAFGRPARGAGLGDRHGLTTLGAVLLVLAVGLVGVGIDVLTGTGLRLVFGACFVIACALAALLIRREDLRAAAVLPPLLYLALALVAAELEAPAGGGSFLSAQIVSAVNALVVGAPTLVTATVVALVVVVVRALGSRR